MPAKAIWSAGDKFLTMLSGGDAPSAVGDPTSFTEELKKRLIELTLVLYPSKAPLLENISMLTALQRLELRSCFTPGWSGELYRDLAGQTIVLKLPHLTSLWLEYLENGELVVLCPKLAEARFKAMASMRMAVKEAALTNLVLGGCEGVQDLVESLKDKLQSLQSLTIWYCHDVGWQVTEAMCKMPYLQTLEYGELPAGCMPSSFPPSLRELELCPDDWCLDLPGGLKKLHKLRKFKFDTECESWEITRPLDELLPVDSLEGLRLGCYILDCTGAKAWRSEKVPRDVLKCADMRSKYSCICQHT